MPLLTFVCGCVRLGHEYLDVGEVPVPGHLPRAYESLLHDPRLMARGRIHPGTDGPVSPDGWRLLDVAYLTDSATWVLVEQKEECTARILFVKGAQGGFRIQQAFGSNDHIPLRPGPFEWESADRSEQAHVLPTDWDFDGHTDIALQCGWGATGNLMYDLWVRRGGRWRYLPAFRDVTSPRRDPERRVILGFSSGGMASCIHTETEHGWTNGNLVLLWEQDQDWDMDRRMFHRVERRLVDGAMAVKRDEWLMPAEGGWEE